MSLKDSLLCSQKVIQLKLVGLQVKRSLYFQEDTALKNARLNFPSKTTSLPTLTSTLCCQAQGRR